MADISRATFLSASALTLAGTAAAFSHVEPAFAGEDTESLIAAQSDLFKTQDLASAQVSQQDLYRLYNIWDSQHIYTLSAAERDKLVKAGWKGEGIGWYAGASGVAVKPTYTYQNLIALLSTHQTNGGVTVNNGSITKAQRSSLERSFKGLSTDSQPKRT